ncbi:hypothetical protein [Algoriphagus aquimarinus]|uniref:Uncharacterized protein n=1 Tax=Algoriphagus aquimarinus TaxID=237018 RepID=A0A5C7A7M5_9BACT|nr:hypothetical protein [Algoriphagus aquimarinus]TXE01844.1 hypothetical protein ESV85_21880 [Algoriphagus aquimarinus]
MYNWAAICSELKDMEKRVEAKLSRIYSDNPNPIPYERIAKGKQIGALSRALRQFIEQENEKDATVILLMLQGMGVMLKAVR